jgi:hypothetical protein
MAAAIEKVVIAGLDPAIHRATRICNILMDPRVKPGGDELKMRRAA